MIRTLPTLALSLLDRLLGLDESMSLSGEHTELGWEYPLPGWVWLLVVLLAIAIAHGSYARMVGSRAMRTILASFRVVLLLLVVVLLTGPSVVRTDVNAEPDWLLVMVDRSASMGFEDIELSGQAISREASLRQALASQFAVFGDQRLGKQRNIVWFGYDREAYPLESFTDPAQLNEPLAQATNLRTAIDQALQAAAGRNISGLVVFGDGQSPQPTGETYIDKLKRLDVPVFAVPLGSSVPRLDLAIDRVDSPVTAFAGDLVPLSVTVRRLDVLPGEENKNPIDPAEVIVKLIDTDTGQVMDEQTLKDTGFGKPMHLQAKTDRAGELKLSVQVEYAGKTDKVLREIAVSNNSKAVSIAMVDRPIKVLYVEGMPRHEYRFLVPMLKREESIDSSILLVDADPSFVQEGNTPITRFPQTAEEIRPYDLIVIGDVHPRYFSDRQLALIREHVATRGAGLLWIGGERYTPNLYAGTDLELLLPMIAPSAVGRLISESGWDIAIKPTDAAAELNLLRLSLRGSGESSTGLTDWPSKLSPFRWAQDLGPLRPGARPLAEAVDLKDPVTGLGAPLVVLYRFGAGELIYVATDETWRWRKDAGEVYFEQFWIQLMRKLGRSRVQQLDDRARFTVAPVSVDLGSTQLVELIIEDPALIRDTPPSVRVKVLQQTDNPDQPAREVADLELRPAGFQGDLDAGARASYRAEWRSDQPGRFLLKVTEPLLESLELEARAEVRDPAQELARAATDHDRLIALAKGTGGSVIPLDNLAMLEGLVPDRSREISTQTRQPICNTLLALLLILGLFTAEWVLRRVVKLV